jgi:quercetin dioxygenase-like cupin family protein
VKVLGHAPPSRAERPASAILHDDVGIRVVSFSLRPGQVIPPHRSTATVVVLVVSGRGVFRGTDTELELAAGEGAVFAPAELHAIEAQHEPLQFLALIAPPPDA